MNVNNLRLAIVRGRSKGHGLGKVQAAISLHAALLVETGKKSAMVNAG
jgi:hypothetical protein